MTDSSDATPAREELRSCAYCDKTGADCCVRQPTAGPPVFAHQACAREKDVKPLYRLTKEPPAVVVTFPWA
ncbi:hypothetical protein [Streptomyces sp. CB01201]|uniref:hypothetical protein n=1 Tax=Streptomyces sp. CB01201 TaxID=2020324 RepID=UPI00131BAC29|nr:hypothetical protein [Streptomyces sp. CB01201]